MAFPIPASLDLQLSAGDVTCNCCNSQLSPEDQYVVPKGYIPPSVFTRIFYPNYSNAQREDENQKVYTKLEDYLTTKVGTDKAKEILGDRSFPLKLGTVNEKRTMAEIEVMRRLLNNAEPPLPLLETKPHAKKTKDIPLSVQGEYPGSFKTDILAGKIKRTTKASPDQIKEITKNIESTLNENYSGQIESTIIRSLLVNELKRLEIKIKTD